MIVLTLCGFLCGFVVGMDNLVSGLVKFVDGIFAMDEGTIRGSRDVKNNALHMVSAYVTKTDSCLAQEEVTTRGEREQGVSLKECELYLWLLNFGVLL